MIRVYIHLVTIGCKLGQSEHFFICFVIEQGDINDQFELKRVQFILMRIELVTQTTLIFLLKDLRLRFRKGDVLSDIIRKLSQH